MTREEKLKRLAELKQENERLMEVKSQATAELEFYSKAMKAMEEVEEVDPLAMPKDLTKYPSVIGARLKDVATNPETQKQLAADFPGFTAGAATGLNYVNRVPGVQKLPKIPKLLVQGLASVGGGLIGSKVTGPYVKPYTDAAHDGITEAYNSSAFSRPGVMSLGDDFSQGLPQPGGPSIIDNTMVPYETVDSSSTGVIRPNAPQL